MAIRCGGWTAGAALLCVLGSGCATATLSDFDLRAQALVLPLPRLEREAKQSDHHRRNALGALFEKCNEPGAARRIALVMDLGEHPDSRPEGYERTWLEKAATACPLEVYRMLKDPARGRAFVRSGQPMHPSPPTVREVVIIEVARRVRREADDRFLVGLWSRRASAECGAEASPGQPRVMPPGMSREAFKKQLVAECAGDAAARGQAGGEALCTASVDACRDAYKDGEVQVKLEPALVLDGWDGASACKRPLKGWRVAPSPTGDTQPRRFTLAVGPESPSVAATKEILADLLKGGGKPSADALRALLYGKGYQGDLLDAAALLLDAGAPVDQVQEDDQLPLESAVSNGQVEVVRFLLGHRADPNAASPRGGRALERLARAPVAVRAELATMLLAAGARPAQARCLESADLFAKNPSVVRQLLNGGADPNMTSGTPLAVAIASGRPDLVAELLRRGASVRSRPYSGGRTHLHEAVQMGNARVIELLLKAGHPIDEVDNLKVTPLDLADALKRPAIVALLERSGATRGNRDAQAAAQRAYEAQKLHEQEEDRRDEAERRANAERRQEREQLAEAERQREHQREAAAERGEQARREQAAAQYAADSRRQNQQGINDALGRIGQYSPPLPPPAPIYAAPRPSSPPAGASGGGPGAGAGAGAGAAQAAREREGREKAERAANEQRQAAEATRREAEALAAKRARERAEREAAARANQDEEARAKRDYLARLATETRLMARTCPDGEGKYYVVGSRPKVKPEPLSCVDVHYEALCPGHTTGSRGVASNFLGISTDCFMGDTATITPKPPCAVKEVRVVVRDVRACRK